MVITSPARLRYDLARFLERDRHITVPPFGYNMIQFGIIEGNLCAVKILGKRQIYCRNRKSVNVDLHMAFTRCRRPNPPNTAGTFHLTPNLRITFLTQTSIIVSIRIPSQIMSVFILAGTVITGPLETFFPRFRQHGQLF